jgi:hypothetical protein
MSHRPSIKQAPGADEARLRRFAQVVDLRRGRREEQRSAQRQKIVSAAADDHEQLQSHAVTPKDALLQKWIPLAQQLTAQPKTATQGMRYFRSMLSRSPNDAIDEVVAAGAIERALYFLRLAPEASSGTLRFECSWVLTNITSGDNATAVKVLRGGFAQVAATWIGAAAAASDEWALLENLAWSLGNLAGDVEAIARQVAKEGGLEALFHLLETDALYDDTNLQQAAARLQCREQAFWALSNFFRHRSADLRSRTMLTRIAPILARAMTHPKTRLDGAWLLAFLTNHATDECLVAIDELCRGPLGIAVQALRATDDVSTDPCLAPLLRCLGNLCSGPDSVAASLIRQGLLAGLATLLPHVGPGGRLKGQRKDVYWILSNLAAAGQFAEAIHAANVFPGLAALTRTERQAEMQLELYFFWENLLACTPRDDLVRFFFASPDAQHAWNADVRPQWLETLARATPAAVVQRSLACVLASLRNAPDTESYAGDLRSRQVVLEQLDELLQDEDDATALSSARVQRILLPEE